MEYCEHNNVIFRGDKAPGFEHVRMTEKLVGGQWKPAGVSGLDALCYGQSMTEAEAKEFQGDGWPAEEAKPA